jgi:hypothetical protein
MQWLNDKKNLPFVIGGVVVLVIAAVVFIFMMNGNSGTGDSASTSGEISPSPAASPANTGTPSAPGGAVPGSASPTPGMMPSPTSATPGTPGATATLGQSGSVQTASAAVPTPLEAWRADPFAPDVVKGKKTVVRQPLVGFPMPGRLFLPKPAVPNKLVAAAFPQPPRRVAGILYGERVNALIQTPDGFETVRPGQTLSDGTLVDRIERDRVILRTASMPGRPSKLIEIKLAASVAPLESAANSSGTPASGRGFTSPGVRRSGGFNDGNPM